MAMPQEQEWSSPCVPGWSQLQLDPWRCWGLLELSHEAPWPGHHGQGDFVPLLLQHWD